MTGRIIGAYKVLNQWILDSPAPITDEDRVRIEFITEHLADASNDNLDLEQRVKLLKSGEALLDDLVERRKLSFGAAVQL